MAEIDPTVLVTIPFGNTDSLITVPVFFDIKLDIMSILGGYFRFKKLQAGLGTQTTKCGV